MRSGYRHEDKYLLTGVEECVLAERARAVMDRDPHVGEKGYYSIRSLYFDDPADTCLHDSENGNDPRAKFRIRIYDDDISFIRLEKKIKIRGMTKKVSAAIDVDECRAIIAGDYNDLIEGSEDIKQKLISEMQLKCMRPVITVSYDRVPFTYEPADIRFTIDKNLCFETDTDSFLSFSGRDRIPVRVEGRRIMELKWNEYVPAHIMDCLRIDNLSRDRFSKYYICRMAAR